MGQAFAVLIFVLGGAAVAWASIPSLHKPVAPQPPLLPNVPNAPEPVVAQNWLQNLGNQLDKIFPPTVFNEPAPVGFTGDPVNLSPSVKLPPAIAVLCDKWAGYYSLNKNIIRAQCWKESGGNQSARSSAGAIGLMQLLPATAAELGVDPYDADSNMHGGCKYMSQLLKRYGTYDIALAAYNAGIGNVDKYGGKIPPFAETQNYVAVILENAGFGDSNAANA